MVSVPKLSLMRSWQIMQYVKGSMSISDELHLTETRRIPHIRQSNHVLVKVKATSVNPIDLFQLKGYGNKSFKIANDTLSLLKFEEPSTTEFPLTVGRDFCGEIILAGPTAEEKGFKPGSVVCGATFPHQSLEGAGSFAEYLICPIENITNMNVYNVKPVVATSLMYAGLTAWAALEDTGNFNPLKDQCTKRVLITGATGGLGYIAAQLASNANAQVDVIVPEDEKALEMMKRINVCNVYQRPELPPPEEKYDLILDCVRPRELTDVNHDLRNLLNFSCSSVYINLNSPALFNVDQQGLIFGGIDTLKTLICQNKDSIQNQHSIQVRWAFFRPETFRMNKLIEMSKKENLLSRIHSVYDFEELPKALEEFERGGIRGKIVIKV